MMKNERLKVYYDSNKIDKYVNDLQVEVYQEFQSLNIDKYEGKPVFLICKVS